MIPWETLIPHIIHDVRALARKGMSASELLERKLGAQTDPELAVLLSSMVSSQRDLNLFMTRLGKLAQADKPRSHDGEELLDLETVLLGARLSCREALEQSSAEFRIGPLPNRRVPARLQFVWEELISNSCRFRDAGRALKIRIEAFQNGELLQVHFADNGSGWSPPFAEMLFRPFQRATAGEGGFGLGLAIARATIESVGGQIRAELGAPGACFHVLIPVAPGVDAPNSHR
jgi:signal transduction histidine kinase